MKNILLPLLALLTCTACKNNKNQATSIDGARIVKTNLNYPWEITWSRDGYIWITERDGKISRIDPATGNTIFSFTVSEAESNNEGGMLGMALHPDFQHNGF